MIASLVTLDRFFPDSAEVRALALTHDFTQAPEYDGHKYPGFAPITDKNFIAYVAQLICDGMGAEVVDIKMAAFVSAQEGFSTQQWIHSDNSCAKYAAVCHLHGRRGQGTQFWKHYKYGDALVQGLDAEEIENLSREGKGWTSWEKTDYADSAPNRLYFYPTCRFHSRWPKEGCGTTPEDSRLTMVLFFDVQ